MSQFSDLMTRLAPQGWWRLGEPPGGEARDRSAYNIAGTYHDGSVQQQPGAIADDPDTAVAFSNQAYVEVPDHDIYSLAKANDGFDRLVLAGWGAADHGGEWSAQVSHSSYFSCVDGVAVIDEANNSGTWMIGLPIKPYNADIQIETSWDDVARGGPLYPCSLVARRQDNGTYYSAQFTEHPDHSLELSILKHVGGAETLLAVAPNIGTYASRDGWFIRFQVEGPTLRARAWNQSSTQPMTWQVTAVDTSISNAGGVSVRSTNSSSKARPTVKFSHFWVQTLGLTVHAFLRVDVPVFTGEGTNGEHYVHWLGKGERGNQEWAFRLSSQDDSNYPGWVQFYVFNPSGGLGAGAAYAANRYGQLQRGKWYQFVGVADSGDLRDLSAGTSIYKDGQLVEGPPLKTVLYSYYKLTPGNGRAPLRFATYYKNSFLTGALDEIAIFDRKLTADEIAELHVAAIEIIGGI